LPIWFHIGASDNLKKYNNHIYAMCLREKHHITSVGQLENITLRHSPHHRQNKNCPCEHCTEDRMMLNCSKPFKCAKLAKDILECLLPKWHPQTSSPSYSLNIAPEQITGNDENQNDQSNRIFDPTFPSPDSLEVGFQAFVTPRPPCTVAASQSQTQPWGTQQLVNVTIMGTHLVDKDGDYMSGGGAWFGQNDCCNIAVKMPPNMATPGAGEIGALLMAISNMPKNTPLHVTVKSSKLRKDLTINLTRHEDSDWLDHPNKELMVALVTNLRERHTLTTLTGWETSTPM
ncbi:hypothetical protein DFJ58DRAFT_658397, partial [Suillus subalutaceus]|uniref:uncharacterized protein n=1 Tax=Suillus subalutaceus TaxID=48586 RepID=UPI001B8718CA